MKKSLSYISIITFILSMSLTSFAQQTGAIAGQVYDSLGNVVVGANVLAVDAQGKEKSVTTNRQGEFSITGLAPGKYKLRVVAPKFALYENDEIEITAGAREELTIALTVEAVTEQVEVGGDNQLSSDPNDNKDATVLKGKDLDSLPDDPEELEAALRALAGSGGGPDGAQFYIDGFTGGRIPPKDAIREIRINSNPFSAEYDRLGFGRVEILTRPGSDKWRGSAFMNFNDESLNARNPFSLNKAPSQTKFFGGNLSGPIQKGKSSFFLDTNFVQNDRGEAVSASILNLTTLAIEPFAQEFTIPSKRFSISPRFDYQINKAHTLVARYSYSQGNSENLGVSGFSLPSRAFESKNYGHQFQITETAVINPKTVNETRFQYNFNRSETTGDNSIPTINVSGSFIGGGAQVGQNFNRSHRWELQNYTTTSFGKNSQHSIKFGGRVRGVSITDRSESNYGGTFVFTGIPFCLDENGNPCLNPNGTQVSQNIVLSNGNIVRRPLSSIEQYQDKIRGNVDPRFNPNQFSLTAGNPLADVSQVDMGFFVLDDWRVRKDLTLSFGLRYENQNNISDNMNIAPRFGFAWTIGGGGAKPPQLIVRGGMGVFYDRFGENFTLTAERFNGVIQQQYTVRSGAPILGQPVFTVNGVTNVPTPGQLAALPQQANVTRTIDGGLQSPYTIQTALSAERQLFKNTTITGSYFYSRNVHLLRSRNINAPICPPPAPCGASPTRPFPTLGNIYQTESSAISDFQGAFVNFNTRLNPKVSVFANYFFGLSKGDSDGGGRFSGGGGSFPAYSYDVSGEYGKTAFDIRHRVTLVGSFTLPWRISVNPFVTISSGAPFNIITGIDSNGDLQFTERPTFEQLAVKCGQLKLKNSFCDISGIADPANTTIPRNYGRGPASVTFNMSLSKTIGFGKIKETPQASTGQQGGNNQGGGNGGRGGRGGGQGGQGGQGGGNRGGGGTSVMGGPGAMMVTMSGGSTPKPYNLTFSVNANNIFNINNKGNPIGNLNSPFFGTSNSAGSSFGFFGGGGGGFGGGGGSARRIDLSMRFNW